jgi:hypothetical protein
MRKRMNIFINSTYVLSVYYVPGMGSMKENMTEIPAWIIREGSMRREHFS